MSRIRSRVGITASRVVGAMGWQNRAQLLVHGCTEMCFKKTTSDQAEAMCHRVNLQLPALLLLIAPHV